MLGAKLTMEGVAERAGTSRPVLSRRWRSRPDLVIAALRRHRPMLSDDLPDTGSLRSDVLAVMRRTSAGLAEVGPETIYGLIGDYYADSTIFSELQGQLLHIRADVMATILKRGAVRGEVRRGVSPRIAALPIDLLRHELFLNRTPASESILVEIVDEVFLPLVRSRSRSSSGVLSARWGAQGNSSAAEIGSISGRRGSNPQLQPWEGDGPILNSSVRDTAARCLSTPMFERRRAGVGDHHPASKIAWTQVIRGPVRRDPGSSTRQ